MRLVRELVGTHPLFREAGSQNMKVAQTNKLSSATNCFCLQADLCFLFRLSFRPWGTPRGGAKVVAHTSFCSYPCPGMSGLETGLRLRKSRPTQPQQSGHELDSRAGWRKGSSLAGEPIWRTRGGKKSMLERLGRAALGPQSLSLFSSFFRFVFCLLGNGACVSCYVVMCSLLSMG